MVNWEDEDWMFLERGGFGLCFWFDCLIVLVVFYFDRSSKLFCIVWIFYG